MANLAPGYQPDDGSYQVGGGAWHYGQDLVGQHLDSMLTGYGLLSGATDSNGALSPLEQMLFNIPLDVLRMFRPFTFGTTDADWEDQYSAVQAIMGTLVPKHDKLQEFFDGIVGIFRPGASNSPLKDALDVLLGIKTTAEVAASAAALALIGVAAIRAEQAGGFYDEVEYPSAATLPTSDYSVFYGGDASNTSTWGPDGAGKLIYKQAPLPIGIRNCFYRRDTKPITGSTGVITLVLSKAPNPVVPDAYVYICGQWAAGSQERIQARINQTGQVFGAQTATVQFQKVSAAGAASAIGAANSSMPLLRDGDQLELSWDATTLTFKRNGIPAHSVPYTPLTGQHMGFGLAMPNYLLPPHPGAELAGWAWHP
jgi:hypothetical protein